MKAAARVQVKAWRGRRTDFFRPCRGLAAQGPTPGLRPELLSGRLARPPTAAVPFLLLGPPGQTSMPRPLKTAKIHIDI